MSAILWYLHDHGRGHLERARSVLPHLRDDVVVAAGPGIADRAAEVLDVEVVALPTDVPNETRPAIGPWHHAPAGRTLRHRTSTLTAAAERYDCTTAVVDVSAEVTVLARLLGLRTITVRQSGRRTDPPHRLAFDSADVVWVPQQSELEPIDVPLDDRWFFSGPFSRFDNGPPAVTVPDRDDSHVVLLVGSGGTAFDIAPWRGATLGPGCRVTIVGVDPPWRHGAVECLGRTDAVGDVLADADVVITSGGWAAVADVVASGAVPAIVPEARPFDEQHVRATTLAGERLALCLPHWPRPDELPAIVDAAAGLDTQRWRRHHDGQGAQRAASMIERVHRG